MSGMWAARHSESPTLVVSALLMFMLNTEIVLILVELFYENISVLFSGHEPCLPSQASTVLCVCVFNLNAGSYIILLQVYQFYQVINPILSVPF